MMNSLSHERMQELCEKCGGWCCKYAFDKIEKKDTGSPNYWIALRYQKFRAQEVIEDKKWIRFVNFCPCVQFDIETGKCKSYEDRPEVCMSFPLPMHYKSGWRFKCEIIKEINKLNKEKM